MVITPIPFLSEPLNDLAGSPNIELSRTGLIKVGAIAFLAGGILVVLNEMIVILFTLSFLPSGTSFVFGASYVPVKILTGLITPVNLPTSYEGGMTFISNNSTAFLLDYTTLGLSFLVLVIAIPVLYEFSRKYSPTPIILACIVALVSLGALAVNIGNSFSLITTSVSFSAATTDFQRAAYGAAYESTLNGVVINSSAFGVVLRLAFFAISVVMLKSPVHKIVAILGIIASISGILALIFDFLTADIDLAQIGALLFAAWLFALAYDLPRLV